MSLSLSRLNDVGVGTCCCHSGPTCIGMTGILITGSPDVFTEGLQNSRVTDIMLGGCGHVGIMVTGSPTVNINGLGAVRLTDTFTGCFTGVIVSGASKTFTV